MDKLLLKEIILEQKQALEKLEEGVIREKIAEIKKYFVLPHTVVIAGIRRVGKSTLLLQVMHTFFKEQCYYFNFEDERLLNFESTDFNQLYELFLELFGKRKVFFLDEVQNVKGWEGFVRRMHGKGFKFFITGSNASLLSKELGTKLTGRHISCELYPFSFQEFLLFKNYRFNKNALYQTAERGKIKRFFNEYVREGGMPEYTIYRRKEILKDVYEDILYRDIVARYDIKEVKALRELSLYLLSNLSELTSYNKLKNFLKLGSVNTVKSYIDYLENSFLLFPVTIFSYSLKQQFIAPKKIYCIDNGLANAISFRFSKNRGKFLENLVFIELKRRGEEVYYYKTENNLEVDFVLRKGTRIKAAIQVAQNLSSPETRKREIKALVQALKELKLAHGLILTEDHEEEVKQEGKKISIMPLYKWMLK
ncbi:ATP-binding protein [Patescibacteria group bacterium AH-259-L05]|nr:ATP-binding protein [Patescibacteria group bacterium AH-259-L05]